MSVPSTVKCSSDMYGWARWTTCWKNRPAMTSFSTRSRFFEDRGRPDRIVHREADEPAEQDVVFQLFHQQPLAPNRVEDLQQQRSQELLRWNRRPTRRRI